MPHILAQPNVEAKNKALNSKHGWLLVLLAASVAFNIWLGYSLGALDDTARSDPQTPAGVPPAKKIGPILVRHNRGSDKTSGPTDRHSEPLQQGWVRLAAADWGRHCSISESGFTVSQSIRDALGITPAQQATLDRMARDCVRETKKLELQRVEVRTDDSGSYLWIPGCAAEHDNLLNQFRSELLSQLPPQTVDVVLHLFRSDAWIADAHDGRKLGYSLDPQNELYFEYGDHATRIPNDARLGGRPPPLPDTLLDRISHIIDVQNELLQAR